MMTEPKPFASLSSSLLARKGQAKPAMRPQGYASFGMTALQQDDLGWNDMGHDQAAPQPVAEVVPIQTPLPPVVRQQDELARQLLNGAGVPEVEVAERAPTPAPAKPRAPRAAPGSKGKAAFTLRLDAERHLKLRLVCAVEHRSAQAIVVAALDAFLADQPAARLATPAKSV